MVNICCVSDILWYLLRSRMKILLILLSYLSLLWFSRTHSKSDSLSGAALESFVIFGAILTFSTEILNIFNNVSTAGATKLWMIILIASLILAFIASNKSGSQASPPLQTSTPDEKFRLSDHLLFLTPLLAILSVTLIIALVAAPNNFDSLTYHLARVAHWIQNHNINFYPTNMQRQLFLPPFAEYFILHTVLLSGSDRFVNMPQWICMLISIIAVAKITGFFTKNRIAQIISAIFAATIPMGILQSTSTQNDYVLSCWILLFIYFMFCLIIKRDLSFSNYMLTGLSAGMAILTKPLSLIYLFPFLFLFLSKTRKRMILAEDLSKFLLVIVLILSLNWGHWSRNSQLYENPMGPSDNKVSYINKNLSFRPFVSNVLKNISIHLGTPVNELNHLTENIMIKAHQLLKYNINDRRSSWTNFRVRRTSRHEDTAGNPLHLLLIFLSMICIFKRKHVHREPPAKGYMISIISGFILLSFVFKWQPWQSRLQLPLFLLCSPLLGIALSEKKSLWINCCAFLLFMVSIPYVLNNSSRPFTGAHNIFNVPRDKQYFVNNPEQHFPFKLLSKFITKKGYKSIGLVTTDDKCEYPLWVFLDDPSIRIEHVNVVNQSRLLTSTSFSPDVIVTMIGKSKIDIFEGNRLIKTIGIRNTT